VAQVEGILKRETLLIERRFCGPPKSGNGGYVCGRLAQFLKSDSVSVRLHAPPPLEKRLEVRSSENGASLYDGNALLAEARVTNAGITPVDPPSYQEAEAASQRYRGFRSHWFPSCFVCGPNRNPHEGLRIFPGPIEGRSLVAAPWIPDPSLAPASGLVRPEFLWAALDCPGAFAFPEPHEGVVLLGQLQVTLFGEVTVSERCVLVAWELTHEGRKHLTATALFGESGSCRGVGIGTWIEIQQTSSKGAA
jgi:hypothetical protein